MNSTSSSNTDYTNDNSNSGYSLNGFKRRVVLTSSDPNRSLRSKFGFLKFTKKSADVTLNSAKEVNVSGRISCLPTFQSIKNNKYFEKNEFRNRSSNNHSLINLNTEAVAKTGTLHAEADILNNECISSREYILEQKKNNLTKIVFRTIPKNTGIQSIISQVSGGGLREINASYKDSGNKILNEFQIEFKDKENALKFMEYSSSNYFKVNGIHILPEWSVESYQEYCPLNLKSFDVKEVSRSLVLKQHPNRVRKVSKFREYGMPLYPLNITEIINDFSIFGKIISVAPVVSRKLCISIFFMNIQSSIEAMEEYQKQDSPLSVKYSKAWVIWFGKDITDLPCLEF